MKKYFIIRPDGSSIFEQGYQEEFIFHCLIKLLDRTTEPLRLLCIDDTIKLASVQRDKAPHGARVYQPLSLVEQKIYLRIYLSSRTVSRIRPTAHPISLKNRRLQAAPRSEATEVFL